MTLKAGDWLNHYKIVEHIGSGGMGEVYRARDSKLQRACAIFFEELVANPRTGLETRQGG